MTASVVSDLASDFIQECLGFNSSQSKLNALCDIQNSLSSCFPADGSGGDSGDHGLHSDGEDANDDGNGKGSEQQKIRRQEWRQFLEGPSSDGAVVDGGDSDFMMRDSLIKCLVESCHPSAENDEDTSEDLDDENVIFEAIESSLRCLALLVRLRCVENDNGTKKKKLSSSVEPIFGPEFVTSIAPDVVEAFKLLDNGPSAQEEGINGVPNAAADLVIALLRMDRPRNEMCIPTIRDSILLPASNSNDFNSNPGSVACVAKILSTSIIAAVNEAVPTLSNSTMDEEELSMRRETAALNRLQDMRDVMMNVSLVCSKGLLISESNDENLLDGNTQGILAAIQDIYDIAAFAVESQLETLLDERATPILSKLSKESSNQANNDLGSATAGAGASAMDLDTSCEDDVEDGKESNLQEACTLPPLYANIAKPPAILTTTKSLESMLTGITDSLNATDAECWDERLSALIDIECILAGGITSMNVDARYLFVEKLRKMPLDDQFTDLRSQITQQACRVIVATAYEYRDFVAEDAQLNQTVSHLVECLVPAVLNLCKSGTRLMATQGMNCLMFLCASCGSIGYSRTVTRFCDEILGKKVHKNRKRGSVMALTSALRVWESGCFVRHIDQLTKAVKEAATNRDPAVREEGRKLYWAVASREGTSGVVEKMFDGRSREMRNLVKEREGIDSEWEEGGVMDVLVKTGVLGEAPPEDPAKKAAKSKASRIPAPKGAPPRSSNIKRPASARLRAEHGTPFKAHRASTPMKSASAVSTGMKRPPSSASSKQLSTPAAPKPNSSALKFSEKKSITPAVKPSTSPMKISQRKSSSRSPIRGSTKVSRIRSSTASTGVTKIEGEGKENSTVMKTPAKTVGFIGTNPTSSPIMGTPVVNLLARASPLSAEKIRNTGDVLGEIILMLSDTRSPHEQSLGIKALALFAKEDPRHETWEKKFPSVLTCLLDQIKNMPNAAFNGPVDFIRSPTKNLSDCHQMQHLFLQGVRSLLQFVPGYVKREQIKDIIGCMLECTEDAPFEIVHTAERCLHNLVTGTNAELCFEYLLPFTSIEIDLNDKNSPPALLSTLRTMRYLVERMPVDSLKKALPSLASLFHTALCHKSVDMRKATVFILVEMHFVLGDDLGLDEFTDCQRRLIYVYIERHPKNSQMDTEVLPQQVSTQLISA